MYFSWHSCCKELKIYWFTANVMLHVMSLPYPAYKNINYVLRMFSITYTGYWVPILLSIHICLCKIFDYPYCLLLKGSFFASKHYVIFVLTGFEYYIHGMIFELYISNAESFCVNLIHNFNIGKVNLSYKSNFINIYWIWVKEKLEWTCTYRNNLNM